MADSNSYWEPGDLVTCHAEAAIVGATFVAISGPMSGGNPQVGTAGSGVTGLTTQVVGVAKTGADAAAKVLVATEGVHGVVAGANLTAGMRVTANSTGLAIEATAGIYHGIAWDDITSGAQGPIKITPNASIDTDVS